MCDFAKYEVVWLFVLLWDIIHSFSRIRVLFCSRNTWIVMFCPDLLSFTHKLLRAAVIWESWILGRKETFLGTSHFLSTVSRPWTLSSVCLWFLPMCSIPPRKMDPEPRIPRGIQAQKGKSRLCGLWRGWDHLWASGRPLRKCCLG